MQTTISPDKGPEAARLALKLIDWNYGLVCKKLVENLIHHGRQSLVELLVTSKMKRESVMVALLNMVQQNCVCVYSSLLPNGRQEYVYEADISRILLLMRVPLFLVLLSKALPTSTSDESRAVIHTLIHHGRLRIPQIVEMLMEGDTTSQNRANILNSIRNLINCGLIERAPLCSLPPAPDYIHLNARKRKPTSQSHDDAEADAITNAQIRAREEYASKRFQIADAHIDVTKEEEGVKQVEAHMNHEEEVKKEQGNHSNARSSGAECKDIVLWRVNFDKMNRLACRYQVLEFFKTMCSGDHIKVLELMLLSVHDDGTRSDSTERTTPMDVRSLQKASAEIHDVPLTLKTIKEIISEIEALPALNSCFISHGGKYHIDTSKAIKLAQLSSLLGMIGSRFGESAKRVWNMLWTCGQLEQKAIATEAMIPNAEAREVLYAMLRNGFVSLQDVPRNADRAPSRTFYTWRATLHSSNVRAITMLYRSANNLLARMAAETSKNSELLRRVHLVNQGRMESSQLDATSLRKLRLTVRIFEASLIEIDSQIAIFSSK